MICWLKRPPKEPEGTSGWGTRNSTVGQLLQVERAGIEPTAVDPKQVQAILDADKPK
jgi:hypothetical protein